MERVIFVQRSVIKDTICTLWECLLRVLFVIVGTISIKVMSVHSMYTKTRIFFSQCILVLIAAPVETKDAASNV